MRGRSGSPEVNRGNLLEVQTRGGPQLRCLVLTMLCVLCPGSLILADEIRLTSGETLKGQIVAQTDQVVTMNHPLLGRLTIALENVVVAEIDDEAPTIEEMETDSPPDDLPRASDVELDVPMIPSWLEPWEKRLEIGFSGSDGNSETMNFRVAVQMENKNQQVRSQFGSTFYYSASEGQTTRNETNLSLVHDWLWPNSPWFSFIQIIHDFDEFEVWENRLSGFTGLGYEFLKTDAFELIGRTGGGMTKEFEGAKDLRPEGLISAAVIKWNPSPEQTVAGAVTFYPDLEDRDEFRVVSKLE